MFFFRRHPLRKKSPHKSVGMDKPDWQTMRSLSNKLKIPLVQLQQDMIMVYSGFIYGVDPTTADRIQRNLNIVAAELNGFL